MFYGCLSLDNPMFILEQSVFGLPHEALRFGGRNATLQTRRYLPIIMQLFWINKTATVSYRAIG
jgi:hypothetical protein